MIAPDCFACGDTLDDDYPISQDSDGNDVHPGCADADEYDERPFAMAMAEQHLVEALAAVRMGRASLADHYARLARYRLDIAMQEA